MESPAAQGTGEGGGEGGGGRNLNAKYQKLAAEYAKLRSQVQVLKKAVVEEQQKSEGLKSTITTQDQSIRKLEQELDSVKFRNRQLEKRIEILQENDASSSAASSKVPATLDANLLLHVEQNKQLQESLATLSEKYTTEVGRLKRMIDQELVPRGLLDSLKVENAERVSLLNKRVQEFSVQNAELRDRLERLELEKTEQRQLNNSSNSTGGAAPLSSDQATSVELLSKLSESEQAREKLNSEVQILRLKLKRLSTSESDATSPVGGGEDRANLLGRLQIIEESSAEDKELVVQYLSGRNRELVRVCQEADSKAVYYYYESLNLCRLLRSAAFSYKRLDGEFDKLKLKYRQLCDELEDVKRGYNGQVDSLTEHIALLNEKLVKLMDK